MGLGVHSKLSALGYKEWDMSALGAHGSLTCVLQSLKLVRTQPSTAEIESILDSDQRDLIGDFSKVIPEIPWPSGERSVLRASLGGDVSKQPRKTLPFIEAFLFSHKPACLLWT